MCGFAAGKNEETFSFEFLRYLGFPFALPERPNGFSFRVVSAKYDATSEHDLHDTNSHLYIHFRDMLNEQRAHCTVTVTDILQIGRLKAGHTLLLP